MILFGIKKSRAGAGTQTTDVKVPKLEGKYKYEMIAGKNNHSRVGECVVKQDGRA
jgi:hypothetical protein